MANYGILAFDPGGTTGWASFQCDQIWNPLEEKFEYVDRKWTCGHLHYKNMDHHRTLYNFMGQMHVEKFQMVTESFEYRNKPRPGLELISREYIGIMRLYAQQRGVALTQQTSSQGKITPNSFVKKANLEKLGLWSSGWTHAMDAYGHLLYYMINQSMEIRDELLLKGWK